MHASDPSSAFDVSRLRDQAHAFLEQWAANVRKNGPSRCPSARLQEIETEIERTGTYMHTPEELEFGARLAWRNSNRCIGRHLWRSLEVRDCRGVRDSNGVEEALRAHVADAWGGGRIRSIITVFAPRREGEPDPVRLGNHQLVRYAGFRRPDGSVLGDPHSAAFTARCLEQGWEPTERTAFTPLPWEIWIDGRATPPVDVLARHPELLQEVTLSHPDEPKFADLGLKWYAVPLLAEMALVIGGVIYPCAPFNGFYMETEIGARNFADTERYDVLPRIGRLFGLDTSSDRTLWRDRALVELNRAVLHSYDAAGVTIGDHHTLGAQFEAFCKAEEQAGREVSGDWTWLNPPISASQTPQFHRSYKPDVVRHTNFFYQAGPDGHDAKATGSPSTAAADAHRQEEARRCPYHL
jgi:nitric-oxide synthase